MDVKISIIIPVYNVAPYLDVCLFSCVNQTFQDIEIIVVNDGSPDTSSQIIEKYAAMDERIVVVNKENEGLIYARKSGLDIARGEYVFHLDGDDYIESSALELLYKKALDTNSDYVIAGFYDIWGNDKGEMRVGQDVVGLSGQDLLLYLFDKRLWTIWGRLIRKDLFTGIVFQNIFMGEDIYLNMQISLKVKNAEMVDDCLYNYVRHENAIMAQCFEANLNLNIEMVKSIWSLFNIYHYNEQVQKRISNLFLRFFVGAVRRNRTEVKPVLKRYYWDKKEIRTYLWKDRIFFYFLCGGYLYAPRITTWVTKSVVKIIVWLTGSRNDL